MSNTNTTNNNKDVEVFDMSDLAPPSLNQATTVKFNAGQFVSMKKDKVSKHYRMKDPLGSGGYGEVFLCKHKSSGSDRAVKVIQKGRWNREEEKQVILEFDIVKDLDHPNIMKMYEMFEDMDNFYIVSDIYGGGELFDEIEASGSFSEEDAKILIMNVLSCVNYCHNKGIVHRDIKPENILLTENKKLDDLKVIDFGLASHIKKGERLHDLVGSSYYKAPEVLNEDYGEKCDVWSCGVVAFIILAGYAPFDGDNDKEIEQAIIDGEYEFDDPVWDTISEEAKDFIEELLTYDERDRPSAADALTHPWFQDIRQQHQDDYKAQKSDHMKDSLTNMAKFHAKSKLKQATLAFIASQLLLKEEKEAIDEVFRALDLNSDGKLTPDEIKIGYKEFYEKDLTPEEVDEIVRRVNFRGNGAIDYSEFVVASMFEKNLLDEKRLKAAFKMFDKDRDGFIDAKNLKKVLANFGESSNEEMDDYINNKIIKEFDKDGDGLISYQDFKAMMFQTVQEQPKVAGKGPSLRHSKRRSFVAAIDAGSLQGIQDSFSEFDAIELLPGDLCQSSDPKKLNSQLSMQSQASEKSDGNKRGSIRDVKGALDFMSVFEHAKQKSSTNPIFRPSIRFGNIRNAFNKVKKNALPARTTTREKVSMALDGSRRDSISLLKKNPLQKTNLIDEDDESDSE